MSKKSINDDDFFSDENLDAMAEAIEVLDPDEPVGDVEVETEQGDAEGVEASEDDAETPETGEETPVDGEVTPDPHLPDDPEALKVAYSEVRKFANAKAMEAQKAQERIAELEADMAEFEYDPEPAQGYDAQAFASMAGQDPRAAFVYALQGGEIADAQAAIARVQADANELAAMAALAQRDEDNAAYQEWNARSAHVAALGEQMRGELYQAQVSMAQAPLVRADNKRNVEIAWNALDQETGGDLAARRAQVHRVLSERPYLLQGTGTEAIYRGYADAYRIAMAEPAPVAAASVSSIDDVVKSAVAKHLEETRAAKKAAADAAAGASDGRAAPASGGQSLDLKGEMYADQAARSIGARKFMGL